mmetsp:Transcript_7819/g.13443  ORF Transcript_7819/g.13443 Transcript_7819/m.13443 type:complete len:253 (+) Transcript_7819:452-1210(+)
MISIRLCWRITPPTSPMMSWSGFWRRSSALRPIVCRRATSTRWWRRRWAGQICSSASNYSARSISTGTGTSTSPSLPKGTRPCCAARCRRCSSSRGASTTSKAPRTCSHLRMCTPFCGWRSRVSRACGACRARPPAGPWRTRASPSARRGRSSRPSWANGRRRSPRRSSTRWSCATAALWTALSRVSSSSRRTRCIARRRRGRPWSASTCWTSTCWTWTAATGWPFRRPRCISPPNTDTPMWLRCCSTREPI